MLVDKNIHPYTGVEFDKNRTVVIDGRIVEFKIITFQALNALGLIGPEMNGIAIFNDTDKNVVCDRILQIQSGYDGASPEQLKLAQELVDMPDDEFREFVNNQARLRYKI